MRPGIKIRQLDKQDCAAACLASIAYYYGLDIPVTVIRRKCGTTKEGTNIKGILDAASSLNMEARAYKSSTPCYYLQHLSGIPVPSILHFKSEDGWLHFSVLYKVERERILVMDPSDGKIRKMDQDEFRKTWTGYIIVVTPGAEFQKGDYTVSLASRIRHILLLHKKELAPSFAGSVIYVLLGLSISLYLQYIIDHIIPEGDIAAFVWYTSGIIVLVAISLFIGYIRSLLLVRGSIKIDGSLIMGYVRHILRLPLRFFHERETGEITSRINDVYRIRSFVSGRLIMVSISALALLFSFGLLFTFYWKLAAMTLGFIPAYCLLYYISNRKNCVHNKRIIEASARFDHSAISTVSSIETIKYFSGEEYFFNRIEERYTDMARDLYRGGKFNAGIGSCIDIVTYIITIVTISLGSIFVLNGELSTGELVSFYSISSFFTSPLTILIESTQQMSEAKVAIRRVFEIMDLPSEGFEEEFLPISTTLDGEITFENVTFGYPGKKEILKHLSFSIPRGKITTITGNNGCGKSTVASLLMRSYLPSEGSINIGNININQLDIQQWRKLISIIPQRDCLFDGSVLENIVLGDKKPEIDRVWEICDLVGMIDFIKSLPKGILSPIGERGKLLSGGERVKVSFARALYRSPRILIMDEVTSYLDGDSAERIHTLTQKLAESGMTIINITHSKEFAQISDYIVNIENMCTQKVNSRPPASRDQT